MQGCRCCSTGACDSSDAACSAPYASLALQPAPALPAHRRRRQSAATQIPRLRARAAGRGLAGSALESEPPRRHPAPVAHLAGQAAERPAPLICPASGLPWAWRVPSSSSPAPTPPLQAAHWAPVHADGMTCARAGGRRGEGLSSGSRLATRRSQACRQQGPHHVHAAIRRHLHDSRPVALQQEAGGGARRIGGGDGRAGGGGSGGWQAAAVIRPLGGRLALGSHLQASFRRSARGWGAPGDCSGRWTSLLHFGRVPTPPAEPSASV